MIGKTKKMTTEEELKDNCCIPRFNCTNIGGECIYFIAQEKFPQYCFYDTNRCGSCASLVAQMNSMIRLIKKAGLTVEHKMVE